MAKVYAVRNISDKPARPIMLTIGMSGGDPGAAGKSRMISTDGIPVFLSESDYDQCKESIVRLQKARMLHVDIIDKPEAKAPQPKKEVAEELLEIPFAPVESVQSVLESMTLDQCITKDQLETYALAKHGVDLDKRKSVKALRLEIEELEA